MTVAEEVPIIVLDAGERDVLIHSVLPRATIAEHKPLAGRARKHSGV